MAPILSSGHRFFPQPSTVTAIHTMTTRTPTIAHIHSHVLIMVSSIVVTSGPVLNPIRVPAPAQPARSVKWQGRYRSWCPFGLRSIQTLFQTFLRLAPAFSDLLFPPTADC